MLLHSCCSSRMIPKCAWKVSSYLVQSHASLQNGTEEIGGLQPRSNFRLTFHEMVMEAPELFGPCAMQTLYIHESAGFKDIHQASAVAFQPAQKREAEINAHS